MSKKLELYIPGGLYKTERDLDSYQDEIEYYVLVRVQWRSLEDFKQSKQISQFSDICKLQKILIIGTTTPADISGI